MQARPSSDARPSFSSSEATKVRYPPPHPPPMLIVGVTQLIRAARVDLKSLVRLVHGLESGSLALASDKLRTDCFDVFNHHLRKPVEHQKCKEFAWIRMITSSLYGIARLGSRYFNVDPIHRQRYKLCWPSILQWLEAIIEGGYFHKDEDFYFNMASLLFEVAWTVRREYYDEDDVFGFAVRLWVGHRGGDGGDHYTAQPLIACMQRKVARNECSRAEEILLACGVSAEQLTDKIVARLKRAKHSSSSISVPSITPLINMLGHLISLTERTLLAVASRKVGRILVLLMTEIVNSSEVSKSDMVVLRLTQRMFHTFLRWRRIDYVVSLMDAGILGLLLKTASLGFDDALDYQSSHWTSRAANSVSEYMVLQELVLCLPYHDMVVATRDRFRELYMDEINVKELLGTSSNKFREVWKTFETVALEQAVLQSLFDVEYAPDSGVCSNVSLFIETLSSCVLTETRIPRVLAVALGFEKITKSVRGAPLLCIAAPRAKGRIGNSIERIARRSMKHHVCSKSCSQRIILLI